MKIMLKTLRFLAMLMLLLNAGALLSGCERDSDAEDAVEDVGEAVEDAGEDVQDAAD